MYPLNLIRPSTDVARVPVGFAVANDEDEHAALSAQGYEPKLAAAAQAVETEEGGHTLESARAALDEAGVAYDKRWGLAKLVGLIG